jgi:hypothetical protein
MVVPSFREQVGATRSAWLLVQTGYRINLLRVLGKQRKGRTVCLSADIAELGTLSHEKKSLQAGDGSYIFPVHGEMSERLKEHDWKSCVR